MTDFKLRMDYTNALLLLWRATDEVKRAGKLCPIPLESLHLNTRDGVDYDLAADDFIVQSEEEWQHATVAWRQKAFNADGGWSRRMVLLILHVGDITRLQLECGHTPVGEMHEAISDPTPQTFSCAVCRDLGYGLDAADPFEKAGPQDTFIENYWNDVLRTHPHSPDPVDPYVVVRIDRDSSSIPEDRLRYLVHFGELYEAMLEISHDGLSAWLGGRVIGEGPATLDPVAWLQRFGYEVVTVSS